MSLKSSLFRKLLLSDVNAWQFYFPGAMYYRYTHEYYRYTHELCMVFIVVAMSRDFCKLPGVT